MNKQVKIKVSGKPNNTMEVNMLKDCLTLRPDQTAPTSITPSNATVAVKHPRNQPLTMRGYVSQDMSSSQDRIECTAQRLVPEHKTPAQRLVRQHALAAEQKLVREVTADPPQQA